MENQFEATVAIDQYDPEEFQFEKKGHKLAIAITGEGARIRLITPGVPEENQADIYIEARKDGFHIMAHPNRDEEPVSRFVIPNDGETVRTLIEA